MRSAWWWLVGALLVVSVVLRHNLLFLMTLLLALVGGVSQLWARYCLAAVSYRRRLGATRLFLGEETTLDVEITNAKPLPLPWLRADDEFPEKLEFLGGQLASGYRPGRRQLSNLLSLRWYERVTRHHRLRGVQRGAWELGPVQIAAEDIFGFTVKHEDITETQTLVVYPRIVPLTALGLPAQHPFGDYKTLQRVIADPIRLMGAREYVAGDNYRYIHWKATARRGGLQTKVFEPSASRPLALFLNVNTFEHVWEGVDRELQELTITTAASIARYAWDNGYTLGLYANSIVYPGGERIRVNPGNSPDQLTWVLEALAKIVEYGRWSLEAVLQVEAPQLPYGATIVAISPRLNDALASTLLELQRRQFAVVLITLGESALGDLPPGVVHYHIDGRKVVKEAGYELEALQLA